MRLTFWGTRGSLVAPGRATVRYGGNTPCVQVSDGETDLILDAGIGIVPFGEQVMARAASGLQTDFHILFSHFHWDHVMGLPFFIPIYLPSSKLHLYGEDADRVRETLDVLFHSDYSPIKGVQTLGASLSYHSLPEAGGMGDGAQVRTCHVCHPHSTLSTSTIALRIDTASGSVVYATDHEVGLEPARDEALVALARGADVLIHDADTPPRDYQARRGWGHSTFEQAIGTAEAAGVGRLLLFHHNQDSDDDLLDDLLARARELAPSGLEVTAARDRDVLEL